MRLPASVKWNGSQNTYFDLFGQTLANGLHRISPPRGPAVEQHAEIPFSNTKKHNEGTYLLLVLSC